MLRRRSVTRLALTGLLLGGGCGGLTSNTELIAGDYDLVSVNGLPLPVVLEFIDEDNQLELEAGTVSIHADGNFVDATTYRITEVGLVRSETDVLPGQWSLSRATVTFTPSDEADTYAMSVNTGSTRLVQNVGGLVLVYLRD